VLLVPIAKLLLVVVMIKLLNYGDLIIVMLIKLIWQGQTGELIKVLRGTAPLKFSPDGQFLITGSYGGKVKIWSEMLGELEILPSDSEDWWEVLEISKNASFSEVKQRYYQLARQYHPDHNSSAMAIKIMQKINRAYERFLFSISQQ